MLVVDGLSGIAIGDLGGIVEDQCHRDVQAAFHLHGQQAGIDAIELGLMLLSPTRHAGSAIQAREDGNDVLFRRR